MKKTKDSTLKWVAKRTKKFWPAIILVTLLNVFVSLILIGLASESEGVIGSILKENNINEKNFLSIF